MTQIPNYPSGSFNFVRRLLKQEPYQHSFANEVKPGAEKKLSKLAINHATLDIVIIGAGVSGLSNAIALRLDGHRVRVYEKASALSEVSRYSVSNLKPLVSCRPPRHAVRIPVAFGDADETNKIGAGIQVPPNSSRILHSWGLETALRRKSVKPRSLAWLRWEDGTLIGQARLNPESIERYGSPYYVVHRAHLHGVLHDRACELGVPIMLKHRAASLDSEEGRITFENGEIVQADLVIAADGLKSPARNVLNADNDKGPSRYHLAAHRATVEMAEIRADPVTSWIADSQDLNFWVGDDRHVMSYPIAGGALYNLVLTHKRRDDGASVLSNEEELARMRSFYQGWDPSLTRVLAMVQTTTEWPILHIEIPERWSSSSGKTILTGDSAHAMLPNMALGAAMAVEDASALAATLRHIETHADLPMAIKKWVDVRRPRNMFVREASIGHGVIFHLPDGLLQQARDKAMAAEINGTDFAESPDQWSDPTITRIAYSYNAEDEIERAWQTP